MEEEETRRKEKQRKEQKYRNWKEHQETQQLLFHTSAVFTRTLRKNGCSNASSAVNRCAGLNWRSLLSKSRANSNKLVELEEANFLCTLTVRRERTPHILFTPHSTLHPHHPSLHAPHATPYTPHPTHIPHTHSIYFPDPHPYESWTT